MTETSRNDTPPKKTHPINVRRVIAVVFIIIAITLLTPYFSL